MCNCTSASDENRQLRQLKPRGARRREREAKTRHDLKVCDTNRRIDKLFVLHQISHAAHLCKTCARRAGTLHLCSPPAILSQSLQESSPSAIKSPSFSTMSRRHVGTSSCGPAILKARICGSRRVVCGISFEIFRRKLSGFRGSFIWLRNAVGIETPTHSWRTAGGLKGKNGVRPAK